jgi:hypothetical protein
MAEPGFVYVTTKTDCMPVEIDGYKDRDILLALAGKHKDLYAWLEDNMDSEDLPRAKDIESVNVEMEDNADDALAGGNETTELWDI